MRDDKLKKIEITFVGKPSKEGIKNFVHILMKAKLDSLNKR